MRDTAELRELCCHHHTIPTSYKLEGIVREGEHSQHISEVIEIWKGRYQDEVVALKVLKVPHQGPHILGFKRVSMSRDPQEGGFLFVSLTCRSCFATK